MGMDSLDPRNHRTGQKQKQTRVDDDGSLLIRVIRLTLGLRNHESYLSTSASSSGILTSDWPYWRFKHDPDHHHGDF